MLWNEFVGNFTNAFEDTAAHEQAYADLTKLEMRNDKADNYIAAFKHLINQAGWDRTAHRLVEMFKNGLPQRMVFTILQCNQVPHSIGEWQTAIQNEVQRKRMIQAMLGQKKGDNLFLYQNRLQWMPGKLQN